MATRELEAVECERCGAEMSLRDSGRRKSPPIIGKEREWRRYACGECGMQARYVRKEGEDWKKIRG